MLFCCFFVCCFFYDLLLLLLFLHESRPAWLLGVHVCVVPLSREPQHTARLRMHSFVTHRPLAQGLASFWHPHARSRMGTDAHRHVKATCIGELEVADHPDRGRHPRGEQGSHVLKKRNEKMLTSGPQYS